MISTESGSCRYRNYANTIFRVNVREAISSLKYTIVYREVSIHINGHYLSMGISTSLAPFLVRSNDATRANLKPTGAASLLVKSNNASRVGSLTGSACNDFKKFSFT